jgi:hypothetical protein
MKIKVKNKLVLVILSAVILVIPVGISTLQEQQAYAPRECPGCGLFLKVTAQFERDVGQAILEFSVENHPNNIPYADFKKLTGQFKTDFLNELLQTQPEPDRLQSILDSYIEEFDRIFLGVPEPLQEAVNDPAQMFQQIMQQVTQGPD